MHVFSKANVLICCIRGDSQFIESWIDTNLPFNESLALRFLHTSVTPLCIKLQHKEHSWQKRTPAGCLEALYCSLLFCVFFSVLCGQFLRWLPLTWGSAFSERMDAQRELIIGNWGRGKKTNVLSALVDVHYERVCARASCYCPLTCVIARPVIMCQLDSLIRIHLKCNANVYTHSRRDCVTMTRGESDVNCRGEGEQKKSKTKKYCQLIWRRWKSHF